MIYGWKSGTFIGDHSQHCKSTPYPLLHYASALTSLNTNIILNATLTMKLQKQILLQPNYNKLLCTKTKEIAI